MSKQLLNTHKDVLNLVSFLALQVAAHPDSKNIVCFVSQKLDMDYDVVEHYFHLYEHSIRRVAQFLAVKVEDEIRKEMAKP